MEVHVVQLPHKCMCIELCYSIRQNCINIELNGKPLSWSINKMIDCWEKLGKIKGRLTTIV